MPPWVTGAAVTKWSTELSCRLALFLQWADERVHRRAGERGTNWKEEEKERREFTMIRSRSRTRYEIYKAQRTKQCRKWHAESHFGETFFSKSLLMLGTNPFSQRLSAMACTFLLIAPSSAPGFPQEKYQHLVGLRQRFSNFFILQTPKLTFIKPHRTQLHLKWF